MTVERGEGRPKAGYRDSSGARVPSVTTVLGRAKESNGLIGWAWKCGRDGITLDEARRGTADVGSCVHDLIEADIHGGDLDGVRYRYAEQGVHLDAVERAFNGYLRWREESRLTITATEVPLALARYGGTIDAMARDERGRLWVVDWKTSASVYVDYLAQLAAYADLWAICRGETPVGARLLRVSKGGSVHEHRYEREHLALGWQYFEAALALYAADQAAKGVL